MVNISRFTHSYDLGDAVALYHSLRMKPVYLSKDAFEGLQAWLASPFCDKIENAPERIYTEVQELAKFKILTRDENEDDRVLQFVRSKIPSPAETRFVKGIFFIRERPAQNHDRALSK